MRPPRRTRKSVEKYSNNEPIHSSRWWLREKRLLYSYLNEAKHFDLNEASRLVKTKNKYEVAQYINLLLRKVHTDRRLKQVRHGGFQKNHAMYLDSWLTAACNEEPADIGQQLGDVLRISSVEPLKSPKIPVLKSQAIVEPDLSIIYLFLVAMVTGTTPPPLTPIESVIVLDMMDSVIKEVKNLKDPEKIKCVREKYRMSLAHRSTGEPMEGVEDTVPDSAKMSSEQLVSDETRFDEVISAIKAINPFRLPVDVVKFIKPPVAKK